MKGYEVKFNIYAESQEEADDLSRAVKEFIAARARTGIAVTARKLCEALARWGANAFITGFFR